MVILTIDGHAIPLSASDCAELGKVIASGATPPESGFNRRHRTESGQEFRLTNDYSMGNLPIGVLAFSTANQDGAPAAPVTRSPVPGFVEMTDC